MATRDFVRSRLRQVTLTVHHFRLPLSGSAPILRRVLHSRIAFSVALIAVAVASLVVVDSMNPTPDRVDRGLAGVDSTRHARVLVLLVDGLRFETANDSAMMPSLARLRPRGASGKIETVFEGFSIPAVRAALSGKAETQLMNAVRNFHFTALPIESVFLDLRTIGKSSLVVGYDPFAQFGRYFEQRLPPQDGRDMYATDRDRPPMALAAYANESQDLIICHYESGDWAGHEFGIHSPRYAAQMAAADSVIAQFAAARRPGDYLLVFGDHGQNDGGEHKTGLYLPTFGLFIGPDITPGVVFRSLQITNLRLIISHALGVRLHEASYQLDELSRFLPVARGVRADLSGDAGTVSRNVQDYFWCALFLVLGALLFAAAPSGGLETLFDSTSAIIGLVLVAELLAQQMLNASWSAFPFVLLVVALTMRRSDRWAALVVGLIGIFFVSRFDPMARDGSLLRIPYAYAQLIPLYIAGIVAKLFLLLTITGRRLAWQAVALTLALTLLEFRVWDVPSVYLAAIGLSIIACIAWRARARGRLALVAFGFSALYFTLRLPLYEYAWIDLFLVAVALAARSADARWTDALVMTGAFTLTSVWLNGGLEWSFLYGLLPAYVIELQVGWFLPMILLKLPLLLFLVWWTTGTRPSREFVSLMLAYAGLRFIGVWGVRLGGGSGAEMWPLAERGMYLLTFVIAAVWYHRTDQQRSHSTATVL